MDKFGQQRRRKDRGRDRPGVLPMPYPALQQPGGAALKAGRGFGGPIGPEPGGVCLPGHYHNLAPSFGHPNRAERGPGRERVQHHGGPGTTRLQQTRPPAGPLVLGSQGQRQTQQ